MASLNRQPGSSTKVQRSVLVIEARRCGIDLDALRVLVGGSVSSLSAQAASDWIRRISQRALPNPPGQAPRPYSRRAAPGVTRMICADHIEQIERLGLQCFSDADHFRAWLRKSFKVDDPRLLTTAAKAGQAITVLKKIITRREGRAAAFPRGDTS
jgi:hypothetical protein